MSPPVSFPGAECDDSQLLDLKTSRQPSNTWGCGLNSVFVGCELKGYLTLVSSYSGWKIDWDWRFDGKREYITDCLPNFLKIKKSAGPPVRRQHPGGWQNSVLTGSYCMNHKRANVDLTTSRHTTTIKLEVMVWTRFEGCELKGYLTLVSIIF